MPASKKICKIEDCENRNHARGLCVTHYNRLLSGKLKLEGVEYEPPPHRDTGQYDVKKIDGVWHRRKAGTNHHWRPVRWKKQKSTPPVTSKY